MKVDSRCLLCYEFLFRIAFSSQGDCYQRGSCIGCPSALNSPFGHGSRSRNILPLDNHLPGLSISLSSLALSMSTCFFLLAYIFWRSGSDMLSQNFQVSSDYACDMLIFYVFRIFLSLSKVSLSQGSNMLIICLFF